MALIQILKDQRSHTWNFFGPNKGVDRFQIIIPANAIFWQVQLNPVTKGQAVAVVINPPLAGTSTGVYSIEVSWSTTGFQSNVTYELVAWAKTQCAYQPIGLIRDKWQLLGADDGPLGCALMNETDDGNGGKYNDFEGGSIFYHPNTESWQPQRAAYMVTGLIRDRWRALNAQTGILGYPVTDELSTPDGRGRYNHFEHGSIYWTPATGAVEVWGAVRERWAALRWESGFLGYPTRPPYEVLRGGIPFMIAAFQGGIIECNRATEEVYVSKKPSSALPNYEVQLRTYRIADSDGSRPSSLTLAQALQWVEEANRVFAAAGVIFKYDNQIHDLWDNEVNNLPSDVQGYSHWDNARNRLNAIALQQKAVIAAFRHGPGNSEVGGGFSSPGYYFAAMGHFDPDSLTILGHELGHHFGLGHTHGREFRTIKEASAHISDYILSGGSIELLTQHLNPDRGDNTYDTPAEPFIEELDLLIRLLPLEKRKHFHAITFAGLPFLLNRKNIMSYWNRYTGHGRTEQWQLTHDQIDRVRQFVGIHRNDPLYQLNVTDIIS